MKSLTRILFAAALLLFVKNSFAYTVQDRHLTGFSAIQLSASYDVYITQGGSESVKVEAPDDIINHIATEVQSGTLKIYSKGEHGWSGWNLNGHKKMVVYVEVRNLNSISISGSGDVFFKDGITAPSLKIKVSGSGDVLGKLNVKTLEAAISGSGDVKLSGRADNAAVSLSGSGDYSARDLVTASTAVRVSGSGDAVVNASQKIDASVSGSGDIRYTGEAKQISSDSHGSGEIHRL
ncbi:head GIN domain-containing protein [Mucilaginibacter paludis]|uniref:Putative auto-transporter adhesin head GIN domain-containing protein n=1 Tax=Mucilaginibacter paludis DSM 18603 TaxID=714943 RepID=H1XZJ5_9SPHI|nr:head GIN domain-containing protein [Mucilaginibacter paludis]EHQ26639.1 hypothetical protein Mucpa_2524 [Mucilaginibacter paludis DSM 18603]